VEDTFHWLRVPWRVRFDRRRRRKLAAGSKKGRDPKVIFSITKSYASLSLPGKGLNHKQKERDSIQEINSRVKVKKLIGGIPGLRERGEMGLTKKKKS